MPQAHPPSHGVGRLECRLLGDTSGAAVVAASGEIDLASKDLLTAALQPLLGGEQPVLLDLSLVGFMDCAGLRVLQSAHLAHPGFALVAPSDAVRRLLELAGTRIRAYPSVPEALRGLTGDPPT